MFGMTLEQGLKLLKPVFEKEKIKTILVYMDDSGEVKIEKLKLDVKNRFSEILLKFPETLEYVKNKENGK